MLKAIILCLISIHSYIVFTKNEKKKMNEYLFSLVYNFIFFIFIYVVLILFLIFKKKKETKKK